MRSTRRASPPSSLSTTKPFKSSHLALPPSPFTPLSPLALPIRHPTHPSALPVLPIPPPPAQEPLSWLWQCHLCHRVYRLGTTRRCLDDGHFFCAGTTTIKRTRSREKDASGRPVLGGERVRVVRHKACASEFDYAAWAVWGEWRRGVREMREGARILGALRGDAAEGLIGLLALGRKGGVGGKDCWMNCDYPSECRWGKKRGVHGSSTTSPSTAADIVGSSASAVLDESSASPSTSATTPAPIEHLTIFPPIHLDPSIPTPTTSSADDSTADHAPTPTDLLLSAKRRKRRSAGAVPVLVAPSPLGGNPVCPAPLWISSDGKKDGVEGGRTCSSRRGTGGGGAAGWRWMKKRG